MPELNEEYIARMEDILEVYEKPYDPSEPVICLDEKSVPLHADVRPSCAAAPGREARQESAYERGGTAHVFCAVEPQVGRHFTFATPDRSAAEFAPVACHLVQKYPEATTIHLVVDNLNIHCRKPLTDYYGETAGNWIWDRFTIHYTPTYRSWLNQAEIEISRQCLGKSRIPDLKTLQRETRAWNRRMNRDRVPNPMTGTDH